MTVPTEGVPDQLFTPALIVDVRRIDEIDASIDRAVDDLEGLFWAGTTTEHHGAQGERTDSQAGAAQNSLRHWLTFRRKLQTPA